MRYALGRIRASKPLYVDTGLIARTGEPIMRLPEPMGFRK